MEEKIITFNGIDFKRYKGENYYVAYVKGRKIRLHTFIWEMSNNKIVPKNYVIHHIDFNPLNNSIENLALLTKSEHQKVHYKEFSNEQKEKVREKLKRGREKSVKWSMTKEGRDHMKKMKELANFQSFSKICPICLSCFNTCYGFKVYCSRKCKIKENNRSAKAKNKTQYEYFNAINHI